jgi:hypothetical protein
MRTMIIKMFCTTRRTVAGLLSWTANAASLMDANGRSLSRAVVTNESRVMFGV